VVTSGDVGFDPGGGTFLPAHDQFFEQYVGFARFQP
jgi:hypothetical protein